MMHSPEQVTAESGRQRGAGRLIAVWTAGILACGLALALAGSWRARVLRRNAFERWQTNLTAMAEASKRAVDAWVEERLADGRMGARAAVAARSVFTRAPNADDRLRLRRQLTWMRSEYRYHDVWIADSSGRVLVAAEGGGHLESPERRLARRVSSEASELFGEPAYEADSALVVAIGIPIGLAPGTRPVGAFVLEVDLQRSLFPIVRGGRDLGPTADVRLEVRLGDDFALLTPIDEPPTPPLSLRAPMDSATPAARFALNGVDTFGTFINMQGEPILAVTRQIDVAHWGLIGRVTQAQVLAGVGSQLRIEFLAALSLVGVVVLGTLASRRSARLSQLRALARSATALEASESRYRHLVDAGLGFISTHDLEGTILTVNPAAGQVLGYRDARSLEGRSLRDLLAPAGRDQLQQYLARIRSTGSDAGIMRVMTRAGEERIWAYRNTLREEEGTPPYVLAYAMDITERQRAEEELEQSLSLLRATLESTADGILVVDAQGKVVTYNRKFVDMWRIPDVVLATNRDDDLLAYVLRQLSDPQVFLAKVRDLYAHPDAESHDSLVLTDGRVFERYSQPQRIGGTTVGRVWSFGDVSSARQAEAALRRSEESYRELVQRAMYGIYRSTVEGRFLAVNPALVRMLGYASAEELLAIDMRRDLYIDPPERGRLIARYVEGAPVEGVEVDWKRKNGSRIRVRLSGIAVPNAAGEVVAFEMIAEDVSERRQLEAQLRQAQKMEAIGQLTGGIAHDFNNLLTVILASADMIAKALPPDLGELREDVEDLQSSARRGAAMVRKLLAFSRKEDLRLKPLNLGRLVTDMSGVLRRLVPEHIELNVPDASVSLSARADAGALEQILLNLVTNARDAMPMGGVLTVGLEEAILDEAYRAARGWGIPGRYVCLSVTDTGSGMDEATVAHVFEPFFTTKPLGIGTGLGMAMVYGLVKQHEGFIEITSRPGEGTVANVYLPILPAGATEVRDRRSTELPRGSETILVVEDEESIRRSASRILTRQGYTVLVAADGQEALDMFADHAAPAIDLVVSDVVMPRLGGRQLYEALRAAGTLPKFMFTSGYTTRDVRDRGALDPAVPLLQKPWTIADLVRRVREVLDAPGQPTAVS